MKEINDDWLLVEKGSLFFIISVEVQSLSALTGLDWFICACYVKRCCYVCIMGANLLHWSGLSVFSDVYLSYFPARVCVCNANDYFVT